MSNFKDPDGTIFVALIIFSIGLFIGFAAGTKNTTHQFEKLTKPLDELINECEKKLSRDQFCKLVAVPRESK